MQKDLRRTKALVEKLKRNMPRASEAEIYKKVYAIQQVMKLSAKVSKVPN